MINFQFCQVQKRCSTFAVAESAVPVVLYPVLGGGATKSGLYAGWAR